MQKLQLTWRQDLTRPEQFGFAKNQVTPFYLNTTDGESIFAWHVLPLGLYMEHRDELAELETGIETNPAERRSLQLLKDDPEARLIIHCVYPSYSNPKAPIRSSYPDIPSHLNTTKRTPSYPADTRSPRQRRHPRRRHPPDLPPLPLLSPPHQNPHPSHRLPGLRPFLRCPL
jgi:hypothetical protein